MQPDGVLYSFVRHCWQRGRERGEERWRARKGERKTKRGVYWLQSPYTAAWNRLALFKSSSACSASSFSLCLCLSCLSGSDGAATVALCQAGCILVSTDTTPRRSPNLASIKVHLSGFYRNTIYCMFFLKRCSTVKIERWERKQRRQILGATEGSGEQRTGIRTKEQEYGFWGKVKLSLGLEGLQWAWWAKYGNWRRALSLPSTSKAFLKKKSRAMILSPNFHDVD